MSIKRELKAMNENLKAIAANQAMIYILLLRIVEQFDHSENENKPPINS